MNGTSLALSIRVRFSNFPVASRYQYNAAALNTTAHSVLFLLIKSEIYFKNCSIIQHFAVKLKNCSILQSSNVKLLATARIVLTLVPTTRICEKVIM